VLIFRDLQTFRHSDRPSFFNSGKETMSQTHPSSTNLPANESPARCQHRTLNGRCRQPATDSAGTLCFHHARVQRQAKNDFTLLEPLVRKTEDLQSLEGISEDLAALHNLLAEGRVSPRRASVIAYIDSLLLRTFAALEEQDKANLNYYGQPIQKYDWSSFPVLQSDPKGTQTGASSPPEDIPRKW
jgi:hypothetical protein